MSIMGTNVQRAIRRVDRAKAAQQREAEKRGTKHLMYHMDAATPGGLQPSGASFRAFMIYTLRAAFIVFAVLVIIGYSVEVSRGDVTPPPGSRTIEMPL